MDNELADCRPMNNKFKFFVTLIAVPLLATTENVYTDLIGAYVIKYSDPGSSPLRDVLTILVSLSIILLASVLCALLVQWSSGGLDWLSDWLSGWFEATVCTTITISITIIYCWWRFFPNDPPPDFIWSIPIIMLIASIFLVEWPIKKHKQ